MLLDVANGFCAGVGIFIKNCEANDDLQRRGIRHAPFLTFGHVVLQIQLNWIAALVAERHLVLVHRAAFGAHYGRLGLKRIGCNCCPAGFTSATQMMQALEVPAFAFPVTDGIADEFQSGNAAKVRDRKYRIEHCLKTGVLALLRQHVHLEEPLVGILLYLDKIGDLDRRPDLGKIGSLSGGTGLGFRHFYLLLIIGKHK